MELEERVRKSEETVAMLTEALRYRSQMDQRYDAEVERIREDADREISRVRTEADGRYRDHESRLRTLEKVAWSLLGVSGANLVALVVPAVVKAFH